MKYEILGLGPTETEIMEILWLHGPLTIKQLHAKICAYRLAALTTIQTVSGRMVRKGLLTYCLTRAAANSARLLTPACTRTELITQAVQAVCSNLNASAADRAAALVALSNADA